MGGVGALEFWFAWRGDGFEVAADVACGDADGAEAGDHDVGEVLADPAAAFEGFEDGGGGVGGVGVEFEGFEET